MIPTRRRLEFATGYIALGMLNKASDESEQIDWDDRLKPEGLAVRLDLYHAAKKWELMVAMAKPLAEANPGRVPLCGCIPCDWSRDPNRLLRPTESLPVSGNGTLAECGGLGQKGFHGQMQPDWLGRSTSKGRDSYYSDPVVSELSLIIHQSDDVTDVLVRIRGQSLRV